MKNEDVFEFYWLTETKRRNVKEKSFCDENSVKRITQRKIFFVNFYWLILLQGFRSVIKKFSVIVFSIKIFSEWEKKIRKCFDEDEANFLRRLSSN